MPARTSIEEKTKLYTEYAFQTAADLCIDPRVKSQDLEAISALQRDPLPRPRDDRVWLERLTRNRERTWLRVMLWERAQSITCGLMNPFPESEITQNVCQWWLHPLADPVDWYTCAFTLLRQQLAVAHSRIRSGVGQPRADSHWVRECITDELRPWCETWLPKHLDAHDETYVSDICLVYVYHHARLWTLCYGLHLTSKTGDHDPAAILRDCFGAAVQVCETAVRDLETIGTRLYCLHSPTWSMITYAAVLALRLFPVLFGGEPERKVELFALLAALGNQLVRAGSTPSHRFGVATLLGQHLLLILRDNASSLKTLSVDGRTVDSCLVCPGGVTVSHAVDGMFQLDSASYFTSQTEDDSSWHSIVESLFSELGG